MEYWYRGIMGFKKRWGVFSHYSNIPSFQYSFLVPTFQHSFCPGLQYSSTPRYSKDLL